ncbi:MAG: polysaccharide biosynthesis/export family protein [Salibacter sp.]|uniref:polysaccharide biosynthesis/export family protein n=1 Tax=Salibacter sp. TaxID=2010995 RepID=UPI0028700F80|nr:polysaccharide biosynthesis/export family protein [Salibacter sp.]MDR9399746.1 polysaccharide biosynthesis/export family protein [Salibacter sp.]
MVYLQSGEDSPPIDSIAFTYDRQEYRLQVNDIVDVKLSSPEEAIQNFFDVGAGGNQNQSARMAGGGGGDIYYMTGYTVSDSGNLELPVIGKVKAEGKTIPELKELLDAKMQEYFKEYFLQVRLGGIRYSTIGEFNAPGKYTILQNQVTIFEAIANSRDLTMVADRDKIRLIRQYPNGTKVHTINLLDKDLINSPYYFIQPNDVIYAEPLPAKSWGVGVTGAQTLSTIVGVVSSSLALVVAIVGLNR